MSVLLNLTKPYLTTGCRLGLGRF